MACVVAMATDLTAKKKSSKSKALKKQLAEKVGKDWRTLTPVGLLDKLDKMENMEDDE